MLLLVELAKAFKKHKISYALVGGHAVALHGAPRGTLDIDFILKWSLNHLVKTQKALGELGLQSLHPLTPEDLFRFREEYIRNRNLIAWHFYDPKDPSRQVDIIITESLHGKKIKKIEIDGEMIALLSIDDLVNMKKISGRDQDLEDIKALEFLQKKKDS